MPKILITGPIVDTLGPHPYSMLHAFIGCTLEADGQAVLKLRETHPQIPHIEGVYEVALADALEALIKNGREEAIIYWGDIVRPYLISVPHAHADRL